MGSTYALSMTPYLSNTISVMCRKPVELTVNMLELRATLPVAAQLRETSAGCRVALKS